MARALSSTARTGRLLRSNEAVYRGVLNGPRYDDPVWDLSALITRKSQGEKRITLARMPESYRETVKDVLVLMARPDHPALIRSGVIRKSEPSRSISLIDTFNLLRVMCEWGTERGLHSFQDWTQADADALLESFQAGNHRAGASPLQPDSIRSYLDALYLIREFAPALSGRGLTFNPWGGRSTFDVARVTWSPENKTAPLPWETWAPLVAGSYVIVDRFSSEIIEAGEVLRAISPSPRGPAGNNAWRIIKDWAASGGKVPLATGYGRVAHTPRGGRNSSLLCRMLGINDSLLKKANHGYNAEATALLDKMAADPERSIYGGVVEPKILVSQPDGTTTPWIAEIGPAEVETLESILRAACYVILASLTGMRDSELQSLERAALTTRDGLPALMSTQTKGRSGEGESRGWWAPSPVLRTIDVLSRLSRHPELLFARSDSLEVGPYQPARDIPRLLDFINGDPATRVGRGHGLGLERVPITHETPINATTLRRSYSVFASTHPAAELGLGIQLGHAAWRTTGGYTSDGQQRLAKSINDDRRRIMRDHASALVLGTTSVAGTAAERVFTLRAQIIADPRRADRIAEQLAENLHLGLTNDCMFSPTTAACGPEGPFLGDHVCSGSDCANSVQTSAHLPAIEATIARIDRFLDSPRTHPALTDRIRADRERLVKVRKDLNNVQEEET